MGSDKVNISYLQFAEDTLILLEGEENNVTVLQSLIKCFELVSGFTANWSKSHLSGIGLTDSECTHMASVASVLGCSNRGWPNEYLGLPLGGSPRNRDFWEPGSG